MLCALLCGFKVAPSLPGCVMLGKLLNLSVPPLPHLEKGIDVATQRTKTILLEIANSRLKQIEKEYTQKLAKSSQIIAELQTTISSLKEENSRLQLATERRLQDVTQKFEDEKKQLIRDNDRAIKALQDELENRSNQVRCAEKKLQHKELESQEQITYIRQEYETKFKGLMPASLRQELEDTISSLKSQVNFLQKRASILQEELTTYQGRR
uniref:Centrosomal protein 112 n=1 Tax=Lynx canadensis TaxID=61383 RepID=A0A667HS14_LYNCA